MTINFTLLIDFEFQFVFILACAQRVSLGNSVKLKVLQFAKCSFSFHWTKDGSRRQIMTTDEPNSVTIQSVCQDDFNCYYQCEVKESEKVVFTLFTAVYGEQKSTVTIRRSHVVLPIQRF